MVAFFLFTHWLFEPSDTPSAKQMRVYRDFVDSVSLKGRLTSVDMGRGMKIRVDEGARIEVPGMKPLDSIPAFQFATGSNMGDSILKERGSDTVRIRTANGRWTSWKAVPL